MGVTDIYAAVLSLDSKYHYQSLDNVLAHFDCTGRSLRVIPNHALSDWRRFDQSNLIHVKMKKSQSVVLAV